MTIWTPPETTAATVSSTFGNGGRRAFSLKLSVNGLSPGNEFRLFVNNVDMSYAAKQFGKRMGDTLVSQQDGTLNFEYLGELLSYTDQIRANFTKYHLLELKDNLGAVRSVTILPQPIARVVPQVVETPTASPVATQAVPAQITPRTITSNLLNRRRRHR